MENSESAISPYLRLAFVLYIHSFGRFPSMQFDIRLKNNCVNLIQIPRTFKTLICNLIFTIHCILYCGGCSAVMISKTLHLQGSNEITVLQMVIMLVDLFGLVLLVVSGKLLLNHQDILPFINQFVNSGLQLRKCVKNFHLHISIHVR